MNSENPNRPNDLEDDMDFGQDSDLSDQYKEYEADEFSVDDRDFDDYDFMDEPEQPYGGDDYVAEDAVYSDTEEVYSENEEELLSEYLNDDMDGSQARHEQRRQMEDASGGKKKGSLFLIIVVVLVVVIGGGGGYAYMSGMLGGGAMPQQPPIQQDIDPYAPQQDNVAENNTSTDITDMDSAGFDVDDNADIPDSIYPEQDGSMSDASMDDSGPLTPLPGEESNVDFFSDNADMMDEEDGSGIVIDFPDETANTDDSIGFPQDMPEDNSMELAESEADSEMDQMIPDYSANVPASNSGVSNSELGNVQTRLDQIEADFQEKLDRMSEDLMSSLSTQSSSDGSASGVAANAQVMAQLKELNNNISGLGERIDDIERDINSVETSLGERISALEERPASSGVTSTSSFVPEKKADTSSSNAAPKPAKSTTASKPKQPRISASSWEIKAIQVGKAVVARRGVDGSREISVGDSLPGLGTIQSINYLNGAWVIAGTQGSIRE